VFSARHVERAEWKQRNPGRKAYPMGGYGFPGLGSGGKAASMGGYGFPGLGSGGKAASIGGYGFPGLGSGGKAASMGGYGFPGLGSGGKAATPTACGWEKDQSPALADKLPAKATARNDASILCFIDQLD
jgi:hypothetical protein